MTREEFRDKKSEDYRKRRESYGIKDPVYLDEIEDAYYQGMVDADTHPHWISVKDEEPPKGQWIITYEPTSPIVVGTDIILPDETANEHHITHWIPLPSVEHLKKGDKK